jgi:hypothetical protein
MKLAVNSIIAATSRQKLRPACPQRSEDSRAQRAAKNFTEKFAPPQVTRN